MSYEITLPTNKKNREDILNYMVQIGANARRPHETTWWVSHYYISGVRNFDLINYLTGSVKVSYANTSTLDFRYEDIVAKYQAQHGRLMQVDLGPAVARKSKGLEDIKKASVAQIALDYAFGPDKEGLLKQKALPLLLKTGTIGLVTYAVGETLNIDVIPPWQLIPIPSNNLSVTEVSGHARVRKVPVDWLQAMDKVPSAGSNVWQEMQVERVPRGLVSTNNDALSVSFMATVPTQSASEFPDSHRPKRMKGVGTAEKDSTEVSITEMVEIWLENTEGYLKTYILMGGGKILLEADFEGLQMNMPISIVRDYDIGMYWGRSFVELLLPMNNEIENTLGVTFQNLQDMDIYGILAIPATLGNNLEAIRGGDGLRKMIYQPDYLDPTNSKIDTIQPANTGLMPIRALETAAGLADKIAGSNEMMRGGAPGRVDSARGLGLLNETANIPLAPVANSLADAVAKCYRSMLDMMRMVWPENKIVDMSILDDTLVGIKLDSETGQVEIDTDNIPSADEVLISVKSAMPKSKEQDKLELDNLLQLGLITPSEYRIESQKRGLNLPVANGVEWQNYRRAKMNNIILFGDGKQPGEIITSKYDMPEIHARVLAEFMARPEYYLSSVQVREAFAQAYEFYFSAMGQLPEGVPYLEDLAAQQEEAAKQQAGMGPMGTPGGMY